MIECALQPGGWSSPAPARARPRRWPPGWCGLSRTGWSTPGAGARADVHPQGRGRAGQRGSGTVSPSGARRRGTRPTDRRSSISPCCSRASRPSRPTRPMRARLVAEHALRVGAEPDARLLSPGVGVAARRRGRRAAGGGRCSDVPHRQLVGALGDRAWRAVRRPPGRPRPTSSGSAPYALERFYALPIGQGARAELPDGTRSSSRRCFSAGAAAAGARRSQARSARRGAVDFADQMALAAQLAAAAPRSRALERGALRAVLLDEYQDTGHAQVEMLRGLFGDGPPGHRGRRPVPVDLRLARGERAATSAAFAAYLPGAPTARPAPVYPLRHQLPQRPARSSRPRTRWPRRCAPRGHAVALRPGAGAASRAGRGRRCTETVDDEAALGRRADLRRRGTRCRPATRTAAVLVRRRSQIPLLADALRERGCRSRSSASAACSPRPRSSTSSRRCGCSSTSTPATALTRLLTGARWRIGPRDLAALRDSGAAASRRRTPADDAPSRRREPRSLVEALDDLGPAERYSPDGYRRMSRLADELRRLRRRLPPRWPSWSPTSSGRSASTSRSPRDRRPRPRRPGAPRPLPRRRRGFAAEAGRATLRAFLAFLEAAEDEENGLEAGEVVVEAERVQLLTVHGAKGLEWDVVAVPGLVEGVFPGPRRSINWTRARQELPGTAARRPRRPAAADLDDAADPARRSAICSRSTTPRSRPGTAPRNAGWPTSR